MSISFYAGFQEASQRWMYVREIEPLNVSDSNGYDLIQALNLTPEEGGMAPVDIDTFMAHCTAALRNGMRNPDRGYDSYEYGGTTGPRVIVGGRRPGYTQERIAALLKLARDGKAAGGTHIYAG